MGEHSHPAPIRPVRVDDLPWDEGSHIGARVRVLARIRGGGHVRIEELAAGAQSDSREEHIWVLEGRVILSVGDDRIELEAGDFVSLPAAHRVDNQSAAPCRYLVIATDGQRDRYETDWDGENTV